uniref:cardiolipin synthase (CMP-forming) n=1 Tax=Strigamia maritima TaxID=126957 RepID=T1JGP4_STRMM
MALFVNCSRFGSNIVVRDYPKFLFKQLFDVTRVSSWSLSYHGPGRNERNVLANASASASTRNKLGHGKKDSSLLATVIRPSLNGSNKHKTLANLTSSLEPKFNDENRNKLLTIARKEDIVTIPNLLCVTRIALSPVLGCLVLQHNYSWGLGIFVFAGITDLLDGMIARHFPSQRSMLGSFLDPMADKLLVSTLFLSLTAVDLIPLPLTALIISRDVCLVCAGLYIRYVSLPVPKTMSRYFDLSLATASLSPTTLSKVNTSIQLSLVALTLAASVVDLTGHPYLHGLCYLTAATTVASGLSYIFSKHTFKLLRHPHLNRKRLSARRLVAARRTNIAQ